MSARLVLLILSVLLASTLQGQSSSQSQSEEWKQLFDGKDLTGWKHVGPGEMGVEDGLIQTHGGMGLLYWTGGQLGGCVFSGVYNMRGHSDHSGCFSPIRIDRRDACRPVHMGY